ncbi:hypothetical protein KR084_000501 [Drosophila pseudotakahashii]|nr:hypothetical protein KR084_000501 [Drosophila pseudotakahashii]
MNVAVIVLFGAILILLPKGEADTAYDDQVTKGIEDFSLHFLERLAIWVESKHNDSYMLATFHVWALMLVLYEGAEGKTFTQLRDALGVAGDDDELHEFYRERRSLINTTTDEMVVHTLMNLYYNRNYRFDTHYFSVVLENGTTPWGMIFTQDFRRINDDIRFETHGLIEHKYQQNNLSGANMLLLSCVYLKIKWMYPFDKKLTKKESFYKEVKPYKAFGKMLMMRQTGKFAYVNSVNKLEARVLEIPYGSKGTLVMLVFLPNQGVTVKNVVKNLRSLGMKPVMDALKKRTTKDDEVDIMIPKFDSFTRYHLEKFASEVGIFIS